MAFLLAFAFKDPCLKPASTCWPRSLITSVRLWPYGEPWLAAMFSPLRMVQVAGVASTGLQRPPVGLPAAGLATGLARTTLSAPGMAGGATVLESLGVVGALDVAATFLEAQWPPPCGAASFLIRMSLGGAA